MAGTQLCPNRIQRKWSWPYSSYSLRENNTQLQQGIILDWPQKSLFGFFCNILGKPKRIFWPIQEMPQQDTGTMGTKKRDVINSTFSEKMMLLLRHKQVIAVSPAARQEEISRKRHPHQPSGLLTGMVPLPPFSHRTLLFGQVLLYF